MAGNEPEKNIPVPDPSLLTTEQLRRELGALERIFETRLDAMDRATALNALGLERQEQATSSKFDHQREDRDRDLQSLREALTLMIDQVRRVGEERFAAVGNRFEERDTRIEQQKLADRISLDAALAAAKEAVGEQNKSNTTAIDKSGAATQKQIEANAVQTATSIKGLEDKITDLKSRVDRNEGKSQGGAALWAAIVAVVVVVIMAAALFVNLNK